MINRNTGRSPSKPTHPAKRQTGDEFTARNSSSEERARVCVCVCVSVCLYVCVCESYDFNGCCMFYQFVHNINTFQVSYSYTCLSLLACGH